MIFIDGTAFAYRSFFALQQANLTTKDGREVGAVYGIIQTLISLEKTFNDLNIVVVFDPPQPSFRSEIYPEYKAKREKMPDSLKKQIEVLKQGLAYLGYPVLVYDDYEADDILASAAVQLAPHVDNFKIVTGDKDLFQLVNEHVTVVSPDRKQKWVIMDRGKIFQKFGVYPEQIKDYLCLTGDSVDNIKGVPGIGPKTAAKLISKAKNLKNLIDQPKSYTTASIAEKINNHLEDIELADKLIALKTDLSLPSPDKLTRKKPGDKARLFLQSWDLVKVASQLDIDLNKSESISLKLNGEIKSDIISISKLENEWIAYGGGKFTKITQNIMDKLKPNKFLSDNFKQFMLEYSLKPEYGDVEDVGTMAYLIDPEAEQYDPVSLSRRFLQEYLSLPQSIEKMGLIYQKLKQNLGELNLTELYYQIELPLIEIVARMEKRGVLIDVEWLKFMSIELNKDLNKIEKEIAQLAGAEINPRSPQQVAHLLYDLLKLPVLKKTKTGRSTDSQTLEKLISSHSIVEKILEHRFLSKLLSTYVEVIPDMVDSRQRLHCKFNLRSTATGRFSSSDPNLQNIPIRNERARQIRKAFITENGWKLLSADYSQIELRIAAHLSEDPTFIQAFKKGEDIHRRTAAEIFNIDPLDIDEQKRSLAKIVNFGVLYGMSSFKLSNDMKITEQAARSFIEDYFNRFSCIKTWQDKLVEEAKRTGEVRTFMGRRRIIRGLDDRNHNIRRRSVRKVLNTPVQGGAADLIKMAMIELHKKLQYQQCHLILQVHDELIWEVKENEVEKISAMVKDVMENIVKLKVPLVVTTHIGDDWYKAHS
ncbi:MAG: DNA polymerase [bacterium]